MASDERQAVPAVAGIMAAFARRTGLVPAQEPCRRYLWTDAYAVCNFLGLHHLTGQQEYLDTALRLVDQVHSTLGRFAPGDPRSGWLSGMDESTGRLHPTAAGLRIGKQLPERPADEVPDANLEWDRDGQYLHYLTRWMHALSQVAGATGDSRFHCWALELAEASHAAFTYRPFQATGKRMYWKMSVDLSRPLVASMGHHDPLDALLTYTQLRETGKRFGAVQADLDLAGEIADCQAMCANSSWATDDPLGTGGLLADTFRLAQLRVMAGSDVAAPLRLSSLLADCAAGLEAFARSGTLAQPAGYRLAFRELGLAIGLAALRELQGFVRQHPDSFAGEADLAELLAGLDGFARLRYDITGFWSQADHQRGPTWRDHEDINAVMLATSLAPGGFLRIRGA